MQADVFVERRRSVRYPIDLPIELRSNSALHQGRACDVSADGLSVLLTEDPGIRAGEAVTFALKLQNVHPSEAERLEGSAIVVRIESRADDVLIAIRAQWLSTFPAVEVHRGRESSDRTG